MGIPIPERTNFYCNGTQSLSHALSLPLLRCMWYRIILDQVISFMYYHKCGDCDRNHKKWQLRKVASETEICWLPIINKLDQIWWIHRKHWLCNQQVQILNCVMLYWLILPISLRFTSVALRQSYNCSSRAESRFVTSQWETALLCNNVSRWLGASLESALLQCQWNYPSKCG